MYCLLMPVLLSLVKATPPRWYALTFSHTIAILPHSAYGQEGEQSLSSRSVASQNHSSRSAYANPTRPRHEV